MSEAEQQQEQGPWVILFDDTEDIAFFGCTVRVDEFATRELAEHFNRRIPDARSRRVVTLAEATRIQAGTDLHEPRTARKL